MCTAISFETNASYFGRNLDLEYSYNEAVTVTPRSFMLNFRKTRPIKTHHAIIGMAHVVDNYPLYYDGMNEHGLAMAGLNFPNNAVYYDEDPAKENIAPFELIPYILGRFITVDEVSQGLDGINILRLPFSDTLPLSPLHWIISDKNKSITVEATSDGMRIYDNPIGVLTNNPPFNIMMHRLSDFRYLSAEPSSSRFLSAYEIPEYCAGVGAIGLPGDFSSVSRFVKAAFVKLNSVSYEDEEESVGQFFHLLSSVEMPNGSVRLKNGKYAATVYSSCCSQDKGIYYYTTYGNRRINAVNMHSADLGASELSIFALNKKQSINMQN